MPAPRLFRFSVFVLVANLAVIVWGAFVRASGSGAGCGDHWPLCDGVVIPHAVSVQKAIEFSHRVTSGIVLILVVLLAAFSFRVLEKGHPARRASLVSVAFMFAEALLGAMLVLLRLVGQDASVRRAASMALHLSNTFFLLSALTATSVFLAHPSLGRRSKTPGEAPHTRSALGRAALVLFVVTGAAGAVIALGDTLFPSASFAEGVRAELSQASHLFVRLRILHPILAAITTVVAWTFAERVGERASGTFSRRASIALRAALFLQLAVGTANVFLAAPVALQLGHLLLADLGWIALVSTWLLARANAPAPSPREPVQASAFDR